MINSTIQNFEDSQILITGGTGSFGKAFVGHILKNYPNIKRLVVYSRDELKQFEMEGQYSPKIYPGLRYFLGDIRDKDRLSRALEGIDTVIHAAALKQVPAAEYNPFEFIKTNVIGSENLIEACLNNSVKSVVALSTDKAAAPINLYGATKLCSDKLFTAANNIRGARQIRFSVVRYGNVMGSRGSVIPYFLEKSASGTLPITDPLMTRFNISLVDAVKMVLWTVKNMRGGEIFVPKIPSYRLTDLAEAISPGCKQLIVGIRPGEKVHEEMITQNDSYNTVDLGDYYAILSSIPQESFNDYCERHGLQKVPPGFFYNSGTNPHFLTVTELRELIKIHVCPRLSLD
jgi:UDP-N-acetylglucosamine 4,6-dehydratase (inverting)